MTTSVISGMDLLSATAQGSTRISSSNSERSSGEQLFDDVLEQFVEETAGSEAQDQRLDALRSTIETMDDSEVTGFLAMLESQFNWQVEQHPLAEVVDLQTWRQQVEATVQDVVEGAGQPLLSEAAGKALEKALEQYMPADESERQADTLLSKELLDRELLNKERLESATDASAKAVAFSPAEVDALKAEQTLSYQPALDMKLQVMTETLSENLAMQSGQSSIELMGAVPATATLVQRTEATPVQIGSNPGVAQTATQANPDISLRQENWSDAMGQRLVAMISEGRQEAQIRLDPPELGTIGVRLVIEESGVSVQMASAVPQVRELLDVQSDRLRVALESQGYDQVDVNVGSDSERQFAQHRESQSGSHTGSESGLAQQPETSETTSVDILPTGFINTFA
ncbi:flagellar hook-length control protein FliK [Endozoicomonas lisbonensis]|uniref:Flagellar hook-length control protein FliK n=1 Tax=Endozoicomonas lisbonensis TaxID=3120522 RepID=A0ABV2SBI5_9GAMM